MGLTGSPVKAPRQPVTGAGQVRNRSLLHPGASGSLLPTSGDLIRLPYSGAFPGHTGPGAIRLDRVSEFDMIFSRAISSGG
jgi:hypothetical protein